MAISSISSIYRTINISYVTRGPLLVVNKYMQFSLGSC